MRLLISTSGYSYKDWVGPFYPEGLKQNEYLSFFAQHFPFAELNFSYYKMPSFKQLEQMTKQVPDSFTFTIKAHRTMTHEIQSNWRDESSQFLEAISALKNKLGCVLLQFPYSFDYSKENRLYLDKLLNEFEGMPTVVEFRAYKWIKDRVFKALEDRKTGWVIPDLPKLDGLPQDVPASPDINYFRFHGRNKENWWTGDNVSRYDYNYTKEEIEELVEKIRTKVDKAKINFGAFNNHARGQAVKNAEALTKALDL